MKLILAALLMFSASVLADVAVVSSQSSVTREEVIEIYRFERFTFSDGSRIKMLVLPRDNFTTREFAYAIGITPTRLHEKAERAFSTGRINLLRVVDTDRDVIREVSKTDGGIGYAQGTWVTSDTAATVIRFR